MIFEFGFHDIDSNVKLFFGNISYYLDWNFSVL